MRVISGTAKGRPLKAPPGLGTRPMTDRLKTSPGDEGGGSHIPDNQAITGSVGAGGAGGSGSQGGGSQGDLNG